MSMQDGAADEAAFFAARGFGRRIGFGARPAVIVIDIVKAFTDPTRPLGAPLEAQIEATNKMLDVAHARGLPVIFSTVRYDDAGVKDAGIWLTKMAGITTLVADEGGWELDPRLHAEKSDTLLVKKYASCFFGTDLTSRLLAHGADTVLLTGCTTSGCVRATAVDAVQTGFRPMVVREAVGDRSASAHAQSLFDLDAKYADVVSLDETLQYMSSVGHNR